MRYFKTSNATRPYNSGGLSFTFEPVGQIGGNWQGALAVEESAAGVLLAANFPQVSEITAEEFADLKKKPLTNSNYRELPRQAQPAPVSVPAPAAQPVAAATPESSPVPEPAVARVDPPDELKQVTEPVAVTPKPTVKPPQNK